MDDAATRPRQAATSFLHSKVFHALAGVFLVFVAVRAGMLWWEHDRILIAEQRRAENLAHVLAEHLGSTFGALESAVNQLAVQSERIGGPKASREDWSAVLTATLSGLSGIGSLNMLDADGFVVMSTNPKVTGTSRRGMYLHRRLKDEPGTGLVIGPAAPAEHISGIRIPIGRALRDADGAFVGFIAATFQPERLRGVYEAIDVGPHGVIQLLHTDGNRLFSQPHAGAPHADAAGNVAILGAARGGLERGFRYAPIANDGDTFLTAWRTLPGSTLVVSVSIATRDALAGWHTELATMAAAAAGMALLLTLAGVWIVASGRAHARTVAERDRAGAALSRSQVQFQAIIDHSPTGILLKDQHGRYVIANHKIQEWYARPAAEILGRTTAELYDDIVMRSAAEHDQTVVASDEVVSREQTVTFRDGVTRRVVITKFPVRVAADAGVWVGGIMTDVTGEREAEEKLRQSQKMEAVGQLTGGVAHDFNNMLTAIIGNLALLDDRLDGDEKARRYLATATRAAMRSSELTNRLLAFSRRQPLAPVGTDVNGLIADCTVLLQRTIGADIGIEVYPDEDAWPVFVDQGQLESALLNLAINARDAMPDGGRLIIETANVTFDHDFASRTPDVVPGPHVMVALSDTGTGMAADVVSRVFEPFFTTKPQGQGTGLGLSMVYGFAKQSGGHISVYSEPGQGTTVKLFLPRAATADLDVPDRQAPQPAEAPRGSETILVVEDDADVAAFVVAALESLGYRVVAAADGASALGCLAGLRHIDLLLTDVILPNGMNGREVMERVNERFPDARVVFVSGYAESVVVHQGRIDRGVDFLPKPFGKDALARRVRASLDSRQVAPAKILETAHAHEA